VTTQAPPRWYLWVPPFVAYLVSHVIQGVAQWRSGYPYLSFTERSRFDSGLYMDIAERGYTLVRCGEIGLGQETGPDSWCGTAGWFPLYPGLTWVVDTLSPLDTRQAGLVVAEAATAAMFGLFWWLLLRLPDSGRMTRVALLVLLAAMPAGTYFHAIFPMSLAVAAVLGHVALRHARRPIAAGLAGALAAAAYPIAAATAVIGVFLIRNVRSALACALPLLGTLAVLGLHAVTVGHWDAYFLVQERYEGQGEGHNPVHNLITLLRDAPKVPQGTVPPPADLVARWQHVAPAEMAFTGGVVLLVVAVALVPVLRRRRPDPLDAGLALYTLGMYVVPLVVGTQISQYRAHLLLVPGLLVLRRLPAVAACAVAAVAIVLSYLMGTLFGPRILF
jgi:hypothetical protein